MIDYIVPFSSEQYESVTADVYQWCKKNGISLIVAHNFCFRQKIKILFGGAVNDRAMMAAVNDIFMTTYYGFFLSSYWMGGVFYIICHSTLEKIPFRNDDASFSYNREDRRRSVRSKIRY